MMSMTSAADGVERHGRDLVDERRRPPTGFRVLLNGLMRLLGRRAPKPESRGRLALFPATGSAGQRDLLQHHAVAASMAQTIRDTPNMDSIGIALYGPWGQGKTMIGALLHEALTPECESGEFVFVNVDAWKYAHKDDRQPLRRHFLVSAYEEARLTRQARYLRTLFRTEFTGSISRFYSPLRGRPLVVPLIYCLVGGAILAASAYAVLGLHVFRNHPLWAAGFIAFLAPLATYALGVLNAHMRVTGRVDPFRSIEDFDDALEELLKRARDHEQRPVMRFVFFIDDLDRCGDDLVLEALETLQAFFGRPKCAYIVAADREQLRRAVRAQRARMASHVLQGAPVLPDETFLEKIFQASIDVPPPLPETIDSYGEALAEECGLARIVGGDEVAGVLDALIHSGVRSPRQARVILNEFLLAHEQASRREADDATNLAHKPLTSSPRLLASFTVLRVHFPWFYELLFERPELLLRMHDLIRVDGSDSVPDKEVVDAAKTVEDAVADKTAMAIADRISRSDEDSEEEGASNVERAGLAKDDAQRLYGGLRDYLARTADAVPSDEPGVQEFLYLRGRAEFEDLPGATGSAVRDAISNGSRDRALAIVEENPELALPAARVALRQATKAASAQARGRARSVFLTLLETLSRDALAEIGQKAADDLYSAPQDLAQMSSDALPAVGRLSPYLRLAALTELIRLGGLMTAKDVARLAGRAQLADESSIWLPAIEAAVAGPARLTALADGLSALPPLVIEAITEAAIGGLEDVITAPVVRIEGEATVDAWDEDESVLEITLSDETYSLAVPPELEAATRAVPLTTSTMVAAHRRRDDTWVAETIGTVTHRPTATVSDDQRRGAWRVLEAAEEALDDAPADFVLSLLQFDFRRGGDPDRALALVSRALRQRSMRDPRAAALLVLEGDALEIASSERRADALGAIIALPTDAVREVGPRLGTALARVVPELEVAHRDKLAEDVRSGRARLPKGAFVVGVQSAFPTNRAQQDLIVETLVVPLDRTRAVRLIVAGIDERLKALDGGSLEADVRRRVERRLSERLERLIEIASRSQQMQGAVRRLPVRADWSWYAGNLLVLREQVGLREALPDDFLTAACRFSLRALEAAIPLVRGATTVAQRDAVLAGVGSALARGEQIPASVQRLLSRLERTFPKVEQAARVAALAGVHAAELFDEDVPARLRQWASLCFAEDPAEATRRISLLVPWKSDRDQRRLVCETLTSLLRETKNQAQLSAAIAAALRFFSRREDLTGVGLESLRAAGWDAARRVTHSGRRKLDAETLALLQQANATLGWAGGTKKPPKTYRRITE
jgi:hypothetical protein